MATTIWSGLDAGVVRYDLTYDAWRPDAYGTEVRINFHLHVYMRHSTSTFGYQIDWNSMWCMGTNRVSRRVKENSPNKFDFWVDSGEFSVWTSNNYVTGVRLIMRSPNNDGPSGNYDTGSDINISVPGMSASIAATPPNDGAIFTTNHSGGIHRGTLKERQNAQVWYDWWGQSNGTPSSNHIDYSNLDMYPSNNVDSAYSVAETAPYKQNTRINASTLMSRYGVGIGGTLYAWVNCHTPNGWLGRRYLGAITFCNNGKVMVKDTSGTAREITQIRVKDTGGTVRKIQTIKIKDTGGTVRTIDMIY